MATQILNKITNAIWGTTTAPNTSYTLGPSTYGCGLSGSIGAGLFAVSSNITSANWGKYQYPAVPEAQQRIEITFKDGGTTVISMKDYVIFINLHGVSPSECTKAEYEEKSLGMRI